MCDSVVYRTMMIVPDITWFLETLYDNVLLCDRDVLASLDI
jgi:hypothetical protein